MIVAGGAEGKITSTIEIGVPLLAVVTAVVVKAGAVPDVKVIVLSGVIGDTTSTTVVKVPFRLVATVVV